jgi:hypothetical protein
VSGLNQKIRQIQVRLIREPSAVDAMAELQALALNSTDRRLAFKLSRRALAAACLSHIPYLMVARIFSVIHFSIASYFSAPDMGCRRALLLSPGSDEAWIQQLKSYRGYQSETLVRWSNRLRCIAPDDPKAALIRIMTLFDVGDVDAGRAVARDALRTQDDIFRIALHLSLNFEPEDAPMLGLIAKTVDKNPNTSSDQRSKAALLAARLAHKVADFPKALHDLSRYTTQARKINSKGMDAENFRRVITRQSADALTFPDKPPARNRVAMVMVSGLPRFGTTLMEARLARHADVQALGETHLIEASYVILRNGLLQRRAAIREMASVLLGQDTRPAPGRSEIRWFSDKMPINLAYEGVARSILDDIRTVIMVRPFLSTWISGLLTGLGDEHSYFLDPQALLRIYNLHFDLAEGLFSRVGPSKALAVTLEGLSEDPDGVAEATRARLDLPKRDGAADPNENGIVRTFSQGRVRDTVSRAVSDQYLPYRALLDPAILAVVEQADARRARFLDRFQDRLIGARD